MKEIGRSAKTKVVAFLLAASFLAVAFSSIPTQVGATPAAGDVFDFHSLIGNIGGASPGSPAVAGINPAGAAWIIGPSSVDLNGGAGTIQVNIQGLLFLSSFTVGTVNTVQATVACQIATGYSTVTTTPVALSAAGSATISQAITLPSPCYAPTVLIQKGGGTSYFAATGYFSATNIQQDQAVLGVSGAIYTVEAAPNVYIQGTYP